MYAISLLLISFRLQFYPLITNRVMSNLTERVHVAGVLQSQGCKLRNKKEGLQPVARVKSRGCKLQSTPQSLMLSLITFYQDWILGSVNVVIFKEKLNSQ
ncbi:hypothetical protein R6Q59_019017 [Mikania micrantha]